MAPSVAIVVLDCLRADYFDKYFGWLPGKTYNRGYSTSHWSIPAHASILTGRYGSEIGTHAKSPTLTTNHAILPEVLSERNYKTRLWSRNWQLTSWDGWDRGFDQVLTPERVTMPPDHIFNWEEFASDVSPTFRRYTYAAKELLASDANFFQSITEGVHRSRGLSHPAKIRRRIKNTNFERQEFLLLNLLHLHQPYSAPEEYATTKTPVQIDYLDNYRDGSVSPSKVRTAYEDCVRYLSDEYRRMFALLTDAFDLIITTSDHGEQLGENGRWTHHYGLKEELVCVPISIWADGIENDEDSTPISLIDLPETITDFIGLDFESRGQSLLSNPSFQERLTEYHGLMPWQKEKFTEAGLESEYERADVRRNGIVLENGYAHEDESGLITNDQVDGSDACDRLYQLRESIPWGEVSNDWKGHDNEFMDPDIRSRLEELGYL